MGLWILCGNKNAVFTTGCINFAETEKGVAGQVEHKSHVDFLFDMMVLCTVNSYVKGKQ
jgi:hypothetical protein